VTSSSTKRRPEGAGPGQGRPPDEAAVVTLVDVVMPQMGVSVAEGTVVQWHKAVGDAVAADETLCEVSTDKIDTEVPSPASGVVEEILVDVDETVAVGTVLARIGSGAAEAPLAEVAPAEAPPADGHRPRRYSPVVQRIAAEHGIDLERVEGTGRDGRVRKQDVLALVRAGGASAQEPPLHSESPYRTDESDSSTLSRMRRTIGAHMKRSLETAATCTTWIEVDMQRVEDARAALGLTALPFVARAAIDALREFPSLNAWLEGELYTRHDAVHLGVAVSLGEDGLIVPVLHDAQDSSAEGLARRIREVAARARAGELTPDEVRGGTFTITNPGRYGSLMATPVINQPQVAILDLEAIVKRPVVVEGDAIAVRPMTILGLSWDHRALDGVLAAQFLDSVRRRLEHLDA
jgi:pyruvate/2-oxoglutarate dehydrogenase complex dihydrolipoamide acyltransferase (E2) component